MKLSVAPTEGKALPNNCYVAVRLGGQRWLSSLDSGNSHDFPAVTGKARGHFEVLQRIGLRSFELNDLVDATRELRVNCRGSGFGELRTQVHVSGDGIPSLSQVARPKQEKLASVSNKEVDARIYLQKHGLEDLLRETMEAVMSQQPDDPLPFIAAMLRCGSGREEPIIGGKAAGQPLELDLGELVEEEEDPGELEHQARTSAINSTKLAFVGLGSFSRALSTGENPHGCGADPAAQLQGEVKQLTAQVAAYSLQMREYSGRARP